MDAGPSGLEGCVGRTPSAVIGFAGALGGVHGCFLEWLLSFSKVKYIQLRIPSQIDS